MCLHCGEQRNFLLLLLMDSRYTAATMLSRPLESLVDPRDYAVVPLPFLASPLAFAPGGPAAGGGTSRYPADGGAPPSASLSLQPSA